MWHWQGTADWGTMGLWMVVWAVVVILAIALVVRLVARLAGTDRADGSLGRVDDASAILARRLANGEIDPEEFARRSEALRGHG